MQLLTRTLLLLALLAAGALHAGEPMYAVPDSERARSDLAVLILPVSLDLEMVDGIVHKGAKSLFRRGDTQVYVLPGEREVALRYNEFFQTTADNHDIIKSKILVLRFVAGPGKAYRAKHPEFRNAAQARAGVVNLDLQIVDGDGNNQVIAASQVQKNWRGEETTTTRADLVAAGAVAAAPVATVPAPAAVSVATVAAPAPVAAAGGLNAVDLLKFTWQNAGAAERAQFLEWVKANP